ncbi:putative pyridoxal phosphate-dependent acyltransferase [compost metagenome]
MLQESGDLIANLWENASYFRSKVQELGFDTGASETPIIPVIVGNPAKTMQFSDLLLQEGVYAQGIVYPTVAMDKGRVRFIVTAQHTREDLDFALNALQKAGRQLELSIHK